MRTIDANMTSALAAKTRRPAVGLTIEDHTIHLSAYQTPGLTDNWSDCCVANDGSIIRVNVSHSSFGFTSNFQYSRITDPSIAAQWASVTTFSGGSGNMFESGLCAVSNNGGTLHAFAERGTGGTDLYCWTSTNNGATWTGPVSVLIPPGGALLKGIGSAGNNDVFFLYDVLGGEQVGMCTYNGSAWSALVSSTLPKVEGGAGIAVIYDGGVYQMIYSGGYTLSSANYNGGAWFQNFQVAQASSTGIGRTNPRLAYFDGLWHLCCIEYDNGLLDGAIYSYARVRESDDFVHWSDGWIIPEVSAQKSGNYFYLSAPHSGSSGARYYFSTLGSVLSTSKFSQANTNQYVDVSGAILSYKRIEKVNKPAEIVVQIDNQGGRYNGMVNLSGGSSYQPMTPEAKIVLSEGYYVGTPPATKDTITTGIYRIQKIAMLRNPEVNTIELTGLDLTERLDRKVRWQSIFTNQTLQYLLYEVCARAGLFSPTISGTLQLTQVVPSFVLQSNQTYRHALDSLCTTYGLDYFLDQAETLQIHEIEGSDPSVWTYQNEIEQVSFEQNYQRANHVIANGKPPSGGNTYALTSAEEYDSVANASTRVERLLYHTNFKFTTSSEAAIAANLILHEQQRAQVLTSLIVPLNPALQLVDVITVNDASAPTGTGQSAIGRLIEHEAIFDAQKAQYESHLSLQGH